jgi:hypothetical protein
MRVISCVFMDYEPETGLLHHQMVHPVIAAEWKQTKKQD